MKKTSRKLLSLLMAFAIICSMVPAAFAAGDLNYGNLGGMQDFLQNYCPNSPITGTHSMTYVYVNQASHQAVCANGCGKVATVESHTGVGYCTKCGYNNAGSYYPGSSSNSGSYYGHDHRYTDMTGSSHYVECFTNSTCPYFRKQQEAHYNTGTGYCACGYYVGNTSGSITPGGTTTGYFAKISQSSLSLQVSGNATLSVSPMTGYYNFDTVTWSTSNNSVVAVYGTGTSVTVRGISAGIATVTATVTYGGRMDTVACQVTVGTGSSVNGFTITSSTGANQMDIGGYLLLTATPNYSLGGSLMTSEQLASLRWSSSTPSVAAIGSYYGNSGTNYNIGASAYVYGVSAGTATIYAQIPNTEYYASFDVTVGGGASGGQVSYSLTTGESLTLDSKSFEEFWSQVTSGRGSLNYVVFGAASGSVGQLTYRRSSMYPATSVGSTAVGSTAFYANASYNQYAISDVTFTPVKAATTAYRTGTLAVPFTAYGTDNYYSTSTTSYRGTLYIMVTNGKVADISYKTTGSALALVPSDFTAVYKSAMNTSSAYTSNVYIQFKDIPISGELYYNYSVNSYYGYGSGTKLTASNIGTMRFSSMANAAYGIDDISYIPGNGKVSDTVTYVAYSAANGGTPLYEGKIVFTAGAAPEIKHYAALNKAVAFSANDFYNNSDLRYVEYVSFGAPTSGTLYKNYANGTGTRVTSGAAFTVSGAGSSSVPSVNTLTYVPAANYTGVVEIPFTGSNVLGGNITGSVKIYVAKSFPDVAKGYSWASDYILRLTAEGVVGGNDDGTFAPGRALSYGEALKMILEATGNSSTISKSGHWASNYLTKAYQKGMVTSMNINLDSKITRDQVAELAAKALGISPATRVDTGITKPSDSSNGYVYALYNAGILNGTTTNGVNRYNGSNTINRAEISKIVCLVSDYYSANK